MKRGRQPIDPELADMVDRAVEANTVPNDEEECGNLLAVYTGGGWTNSKIYHSRGSSTHAFLTTSTRFYCRVSIQNQGTGSRNRNIYRGTLYQVMLAHDCFQLAKERHMPVKFGKLHEHDRREHHFVYSEDKANAVLNSNVPAQEFFFSLADYFVRVKYFVPRDPALSEDARRFKRQEDRRKFLQIRGPVPTPSEALTMINGKLDILIAEFKALREAVLGQTSSPPPVLLSPDQAADMAETVQEPPMEETL